ncbi:type IV pilus modification protein PilV [Dyella jiangningensis]|uniref:type IV pilus modification protein PilV n=1 Tax=Dyella jiangningensis TaxID=1379159 RepID=UPI00240FC6C0|nr:type IV pilus modification protein PilV [Dyella jiangningensis]MDG2540078.1 type IV pilus modification protein PilV [Dyella jiangningensis]
MKTQRGMLLIEVLVSIFIAAVALLGTVTMMAKSSRSEMESYQRVQALTLVQDMVSRINANRQVADCYSNGTTGLTAGNVSTALPTCSSGTKAQATTANNDLTAWQNSLLGAAEITGGSKVGAMIGAVGCIERIPGIAQSYRVTVAWQGLLATIASPLACGQNQFGNDNLRRAVSVQIQIANLST